MADLLLCRFGVRSGIQIGSKARVALPIGQRLQCGFEDLRPDSVLFAV